MVLVVVTARVGQEEVRLLSGRLISASSYWLR